MKNTAISETGHWAFSVWQELKSQPAGISETNSTRNSKNILTSKTLLPNLTARNYFSNEGLKFSARNTYPKHRMCNRIFSTALAVLNPCSFVTEMSLKPCLSVLLFLPHEPQQWILGHWVRQSALPLTEKLKPAGASSLGNEVTQKEKNLSSLLRIHKCLLNLSGTCF